MASRPGSWTNHSRDACLEILRSERVIDACAARPSVQDQNRQAAQAHSWRQGAAAGGSEGTEVCALVLKHGEAFRRPARKTGQARYSNLDIKRGNAVGHKARLRGREITETFRRCRQCKAISKENSVRETVATKRRSVRQAAPAAHTRIQPVSPSSAEVVDAAPQRLDFLCFNIRTGGRIIIVRPLHAHETSFTYFVPAWHRIICGRPFCVNAWRVHLPASSGSRDAWADWLRIVLDHHRIIYRGLRSRLFTRSHVFIVESKDMNTQRPNPRSSEPGRSVAVAIGASHAPGR